MCIYDNSITLLLCAFYASIQSIKKAIDITEMLWYYIITEGQQEQTKQERQNKVSKGLSENPKNNSILKIKAVNSVTQLCVNVKRLFERKKSQVSKAIINNMKALETSNSKGKLIAPFVE